MSIEKTQSQNYTQEISQKYQKSLQVLEITDKDFQIIQEDIRYEILGATQTQNGWLVIINKQQ